MNKFLLFTDGSVNVQTKVGYGASLFIAEKEINDVGLHLKVNVQRFENTSSTKLELQTLLLALENVDANLQLIVYTDSQNIIQLLERRQRLEQNNFCSKKGVPLNNNDLYKKFYQIIDKLSCEFVKVKGHQPTRQKDDIERVFTLVDKASRKALRNES